MKPEKAEDFKINLGDKAKDLLGDLAEDRAVKALREHAAEKGWTQGQFDDVMSVLDVLADKGVLGAEFDAAAEVEKLGEHGATRQRESEVFLASLKERGEIDDEMFGEAMTLVPTAAGTRLLEYFRKQQRAPSDIHTSGETAPDAKEAARAMARDPRYGKDAEFTRQADKAWVEAFGG